MKTICFIIALLSLSVSASAKGFSISIDNIRNDNGNILVMLQADGQNKPVYGMAKAQKGEVTIEEVTWDHFTISVFHDENENWQIDTDEQGKPVEGFAREKHHPKKKEDACKLKLFYFDNPLER